MTLESIFVEVLPKSFLGKISLAGCGLFYVLILCRLSLTLTNVMVIKMLAPFLFCIMPFSTAWYSVVTIKIYEGQKAVTRLLTDPFVS